MISEHIFTLSLGILSGVLFSFAEYFYQRAKKAEKENKELERSRTKMFNDYLEVCHHRQHLSMINQELRKHIQSLENPEKQFADGLE